MTQHDFLVEQFKAEKSKQNYAVVTIVTTEGSAPRHSGKMLVRQDGSTFGTVGGGAVELQAIRDASACLKSNTSAYKEYNLTEDNPSLGMTCGGNVTMLIEAFCNKPQLVMCGAGHVGNALIQLAQFLGFDVTLVDNRPDELIADKIQLADHYVHVEDFRQGIIDLDISKGAYFVIATFGHAHDGEALEGALQKEAVYVGMIGSKRKISGLFDVLRTHGCTDEQLNSVYTPIGLDIGSETPEEIALSIMAEIMQNRNGGTAQHLRDSDHK